MSALLPRRPEPRQYSEAPPWAAMKMIRISERPIPLDRSAASRALRSVFGRCQHSLQIDNANKTNGPLAKLSSVLARGVLR